MPTLITRCVADDYQSAIDNHDDHDRGEMDLLSLEEALHSISYAMPHSSDPESPHRPAVGVQIPSKTRITFFYASDYQGRFSLEPSGASVFTPSNLIDLVAGQTSIEAVLAADEAFKQRMNRTIKCILGSVIGIIVYLAAAPFFGW